MKLNPTLLTRKLLLGGMALALCAPVFLASCSDDDDSDGGDSSGSASASVKITSVSQGTKRNGKYNYHVTVKASGTTAASIKDIGVSWGKTSSATGQRSGTRGTLTTTRSISLSANSTYYLKGYVTTASGTSYTTAKKVRVPN